jgi:hypothetical protein
MSRSKDNLKSAEVPHSQKFQYYSEGTGDNFTSERSDGPQQQEIEEYARFLGMNPDDSID